MGERFPFPQWSTVVGASWYGAAKKKKKKSAGALDIIKGNTMSRGDFPGGEFYLTNGPKLNYNATKTGRKTKTKQHQTRSNCCQQWLCNKVWMLKWVLNGVKYFFYHQFCILNMLKCLYLWIHTVQIYKYKVKGHCVCKTESDILTVCAGKILKNKKKAVWILTSPHSVRHLLIHSFSLPYALTLLESALNTRTHSTGTRELGIYFIYCTVRKKVQYRYSCVSQRSELMWIYLHRYSRGPQGPIMYQNRGLKSTRHPVGFLTKGTKGAPLRVALLRQAFVSWKLPQFGVLFCSI